MKEKFGGSICLNATKKRKENHRKVFSWSIVSRQARDFIYLILPYLKIKQNQAIGLLCLQNTITSGGKRLSQNIKDERFRINERVKELKRVEFA